MKRFLTVLSLPLLASAQPEAIAKERALGSHLAAEVTRQSQPLRNPLAGRYLQTTARQLLLHVPQQPFEYTFSLVSTSEATEPIVLPGGFVLIPARYFLAVPDEPAFVRGLAHAIGHLALRHSLPRAGSSPLIFLAGPNGIHASPDRPPITPLGLQVLQRAQEQEADAFAILLTLRAELGSAAQSAEFLNACKALLDELERRTSRRPPTLRRP